MESGSAKVALGSNKATQARATLSEIASSSQQKALQAGHVTDAVQNIATVSEEQSAATEEVMASAEEMSAQIVEMSVQAQGLAATAGELNGLVARFKLVDNSARPGNVVPLRRAA